MTDETIARKLAESAATKVALRCDMTNDCTADVTMLDHKGYAYCTNHGTERRSWMPCRKLRPHELARLQRGETLAGY